MGFFTKKTNEEKETERIAKEEKAKAIAKKLEALKYAKENSLITIIKHKTIKWYLTPKGITYQNVSELTEYTYDTIKN